MGLDVFMSVQMTHMCHCLQWWIISFMMTRASTFRPLLSVITCVQCTCTYIICTGQGLRRTLE